jgi:hypothetical protein
MGGRTHWSQSAPAPGQSPQRKRTARSKNQNPKLFRRATCYVSPMLLSLSGGERRSRGERARAGGGTEQPASRHAVEQTSAAPQAAVCVVVLLLLPLELVMLPTYLSLSRASSLAPSLLTCSTLPLDRISTCRVAAEETTDEQNNDTSDSLQATSTECFLET